MIAGPPDQDLAGPVVTYVALYDDGLLVDFLMPRPPGQRRERADPYAPDRDVPREVRIDDGQGTEFRFDSGSVDRNAPILRGRRQYSPAPAADASLLRVAIESTVIEIALAMR